MKFLTRFALICVIFLLPWPVLAQRCAVLEFKARVGISQNDVDGISSIFTTYFQPAGYTMVERSQIDKVIEEQGFQRSSMTQQQMVRIGEILNVSKIVVGDINIVAGQYNVDARVINVETGTISATEGAVMNYNNYRSSMEGIAKRLASKIAISPQKSILSNNDNTQTDSKKPTSSNDNNTKKAPKKRNSVEILYGYLKVFPNELGTFDKEPSSIIKQINAQAMHGYNNWRIPTNEELSLLDANNYIGDGKYMTRESKNGIVLLVSDGDDYTTVQEKEKQRLAEEEQRRKEALEMLRKQEAELQRKKEELQRKKDALLAQGYVDLGLPSGTLWKDKNESGFYTYEQALNRFGKDLPSKDNFEELTNICQWSWTGRGYHVTGPNGKSIYLPAMGWYHPDGYVACAGGVGYYWSSTPENSAYMWHLNFDTDEVVVYTGVDSTGNSVRLVNHL